MLFIAPNALLGRSPTPTTSVTPWGIGPQRLKRLAKPVQLRRRADHDINTALAHYLAEAGPTVAAGSSTPSNRDSLTSGATPITAPSLRL